MDGTALCANGLGRELCGHNLSLNNIRLIEIAESSVIGPSNDPNAVINVSNVVLLYFFFGGGEGMVCE